jgi:hypothetical protein
MIWREKGTIRMGQLKFSLYPALKGKWATVTEAMAGRDKKSLTLYCLKTCSSSSESWSNLDDMPQRMKRNEEKW